MSYSSQCPLWAFVPDVLLPEPFFEKLTASQKQQSFSQLPASLQQTLARQTSQYHSAGQLDCVEHWLSLYFESESQTKFDLYPPWAMLTAHAGGGAPEPSELPKPFTRWFGTLGHIQIGRDGVSFIPPEALTITADELNQAWAVVQPLFTESDWALSSAPGQTPNNALGYHAVCDGPKPLPMEQASPWSVQQIQLTDYLPMQDEFADWRRLWHRLQMELAQAPFNLEREAQGLPTINCVWFWGGGQPWATSRGMPTLHSVSSDGVYPASKFVSSNTEALNRFISWRNILGLSQAKEGGQSNASKCSVYCVDFAGWSSSTAAFDVLEAEVVSALRLSGLQVGWVLAGNRGHRSLVANWQSRLKFWKRTPDWKQLIEPLAEGPSEEDLRAAYEAGRQQQTDIDQHW